MSIVARRVAATPARSAGEAWAVITNILSKEGSAGRRELDAVAGIAASLIADECFRDAPAVVSGNGPQVRTYCVYEEDAVEGNGVKEDALAFDATLGDWAMSLPCHAEDLNWVTDSLSKKSKRITARDLAKDGEAKSENSASSMTLEIDMEAFLKA
jgi:hypothetical protein